MQCVRLDALYNLVLSSGSGSREPHEPPRGSQRFAQCLGRLICCTFGDSGSGALETRSDVRCHEKELARNVEEGCEKRESVDCTGRDRSSRLVRMLLDEARRATGQSSPNTYHRGRSRASKAGESLDGRARGRGQSDGRVLISFVMLESTVQGGERTWIIVTTINPPANAPVTGTCPVTLTKPRNASTTGHVSTNSVAATTT